MTQEYLFALLKTTDLPVTYAEWPQGMVPKLPYIVFLQDGDERFLADDFVYDSTPTYSIEIYSSKKDNATENLLKNTLNENKVIWAKDYEGRTPEGLYQAVYSI